MFAGDDDLLNLIQIEANTLVDTVLEESVSIVNQSSSYYDPPNPTATTATASSYAFDHDLNDEQHDQYSREVSYDEYSYDQAQTSNQMPSVNNLNNNNNNNNHVNFAINLPLSDHAPISDDLSENFAIKSDYDIIVKSPTIESMSGKSFEDVDDDLNYNHINNNNASSAIHDVSLENSALHSNDNNTATNIITPSTSIPSHELDTEIVENLIVHDEAQRLVNDIIQESIHTIETDSFDTLASGSNTNNSFTINNNVISDDDELSNEDPAIVRNISEQKLKRVERKFEHLSSEVRDDDSETVDDLVNKEDISTLQTDFSKISWDETLSATTSGNTPDNDLQDVLNLPGDTYRNQHNK
jgi:hypothetical protein